MASSPAALGHGPAAPPSPTFSHSPPSTTIRSRTSSRSPTVSSPPTSTWSLVAPPAGSPVGGNFQIDADHDDGFESGGEAEDARSTHSLSNSILAYRKIHGRTFHNFKTETEYWGPNDETQNDHLDINHQMLLMVMDNRLFRAPINKNPQRVLDVGTGTGIWAIDFADQFPSAEVIGTDLSPIQPVWVPPNCRFELDDAQLPWSFPDNHFDFIHMRLMMGSIKDWPFLYSEVMRCLKPGGWFEHIDYDPHVYCDDDSLSPTSAWHEYGPIFTSAGDKIGRTFRIIIDQVNMGWMRNAGFQRVDERRLKLPMGAWPANPKLKEVGRYNLAASEQGLEGFMLYILTNVHGWDLIRTQAYIAAVRSELKTRSNHAYYFVSSVFGQKPDDGLP